MVYNGVNKFLRILKLKSKVAYVKHFGTNLIIFLFRIAFAWSPKLI